MLSCRSAVPGGALLLVAQNLSDHVWDRIAIPTASATVTTERSIRAVMSMVLRRALTSCRRGCG